MGDKNEKKNKTNDFKIRHSFLGSNYASIKAADKQLAQSPVHNHHLRIKQASQKPNQVKLINHELINKITTREEPVNGKSSIITMD